jgi:hypothetical protein
MPKNSVIILDMMHTIDLKRIMGDTVQTEKKINAVMDTCKNSTTDWAKNFWFNVWKQLCTKYGRTDLYNKHLH